MILAVAGGKGGVGKTTVAYNLAAALDAVAVDADLGMADLPAGRGPDLHDALAGRAAPTECVHEGPVTLVPCGRSLSGARASDLSRLRDVLETLERERGTLVVDCPAGLRTDVGVPLALADACLLVVSPQPFALANAVRTRELARELDAGLVGAACNRVVDPPPTESMASALGGPVTPVPADPRLGRSVRTETPITDSAPKSTAAERIRELARAADSCR
ncbi:FleN family ATPase involved in flagellar biosynthesis [Halalkaliarchaeum sp. AArc-CO]|uniref:MinD/ParA family ATP-binding protein n=1 Tax=unclassified Halalkaliarchaeum TaxID=2678344 RepID=UPI00217D8586|nr:MULTISPECIES: MinD/ParA family protein [unclassified Halalkaliarchaeum]MDR5672739.1 MinD/ParA family protein [Halalkaliarchaeum sp. AArc-GB]UWG49355.1 FleN family ATPase involved in flagellar biosynthesis [Halalkaliarchaeum sp. AArc-CO]